MPAACAPATSAASLSPTTTVRAAPVPSARSAASKMRGEGLRHPTSAENVTAHYALSLIYSQLGDTRRGADHAALHARYKPDDNARDHAIATHRLANAAANHAAQSIVIYPLR